MTEAKGIFIHKYIYTFEFLPSFWIWEVWEVERVAACITVVEVSVGGDDFDGGCISSNTVVVGVHSVFCFFLACGAGWGKKKSALPLPYIILNTNRRTQNEGGLGTRLVFRSYTIP